MADSWKKALETLSVSVSGLSWLFFLWVMTIRSCPARQGGAMGPRWAPDAKGVGTGLVRAWVLLSPTDGQPLVQPGQPVEPVVRLICAVCGGNGRAHL